MSSAAGPLVSIVVPAFNTAGFIAATIKSIQGQTEPRWECVIVDDGSTDATWAACLAATHGDARFKLFRQRNSGASAARNRGYRATNTAAPWVVFMDSDDLWRPQALETLLRCASSGSGIGCHALAELIDSNGERLEPGSYSERGRQRLGLTGRRLRLQPLDHPTDFNILINGNVLFPPGLVLAKRTAYDAAGRFDESLNGPEDWDMLIRLSRQGSLSFIDEVVLDYRRHDANLGANADVPAQAWLVRCINFWSADNSAEQRLAARRGWRASQIQIFLQNLQLFTGACRDRRVRDALQALLRMGACIPRGLRGFPLPRVFRAPLPW